LERATGIEPAFSAWEADVLPLNYARGDVQRITRRRVGPTANRAVAAAVSQDMIDATALLFLHALDRSGLRNGHHRAASDAAGQRGSKPRRASLDDRVSWLATGSLPWERP
jgi:hypothetical protein